MSMREIKFRAWDKEAKRMFGKMWPKMQIDSDGTFGFPEDELYVVMQYTGLKDKNGKEIYQSDLVKCTNKYDEEFTLEVKWIEHLAGWYYTDKTCKEGEWISQLGMFDNGEEVIGNVYEGLQKSGEGDIM